MHYFHLFKGIHYIFRKRCRKMKRRQNEGEKEAVYKKKILFQGLYPCAPMNL